mmetsp:Transcript_29582/g.46292  ORF Transcript_29582/g.46292 Transcript_29582/m.46292 type:complete len:105 (-) Transcript_29582:32-346(-)
MLAPLLRYASQFLCQSVRESAHRLRDSGATSALHQQDDASDFKGSCVHRAILRAMPRSPNCKHAREDFSADLHELDRLEDLPRVTHARINECTRVFIYGGQAVF